ncbi:hypothetical protein HPB52_014199 [Rhipicephalus sanguineus]|uniref:Uncharacterized protein n=1 Tax=Rhipicephalus sanguineus TaxID=34632 RepID=A0A9D4PJ25_RHISA|nr:hypothetical protein HPB52_014199 [Rhipicephalus sanguineus]
MSAAFRAAATYIADATGMPQQPARGWRGACGVVANTKCTRAVRAGSNACIVGHLIQPILPLVAERQPSYTCHLVRRRQYCGLPPAAQEQLVLVHLKSVWREAKPTLQHSALLSRSFRPPATTPSGTLTFSCTS